jgi:glycosyltransferase involved in cell wall biosynthesis
MTATTSSRRGLYVARLDLDAAHLAGVARKIEAQMAALRAWPATVDLLHLSGARIVLGGRIVGDHGASRLGRRIAHYFGFHRAVAQARGYAFAYVRHQGASPLSLWALHRLRRNNPGIAVVLEIPTYPYDGEHTSLRGRALSLVDRLSRRFLRGFVDRVVTFSRQSRIFGIPAIATDNGVDVASMRVLQPPGGPDLVLLGLANLSPWHGYDRVIAGLARYRADGGTRAIRFDVVGEGVELPRLRAQAEAAGLRDEVVFHGARSGAALEAIMAGAHVGMSSLGMHRTRADTSTIKSREFCARGLPFVLGHADRDFGPALPFVFHAPANDAPLDVAALAAWYDGLRADQPDYPAAMRAYAEQRLGWATKMQPVLDYLDQTTGAAR